MNTSSRIESGYEWGHGRKLSPRLARFAAGVVVVLSKTSLIIKRIRYREAEAAYISVCLCCVTCTVKAFVRARHGSLHPTVCCYRISRLADNSTPTEGERARATIAVQAGEATFRFMSMIVLAWLVL